MGRKDGGTLFVAGDKGPLATSAVCRVSDVVFWMADGGWRVAGGPLLMSLPAPQRRGAQRLLNRRVISELTTDASQTDAGGSVLALTQTTTSNSPLVASINPTTLP